MVSRQQRRARIVIAVIATLAAAFAVTASAETGRNAVLLGVFGSTDRFDRQTSQRSRFRLIIMRWGQGSSPQYFANVFATMGEVPMLGLSTGGGEGGGPEVINAGQIARGAGDAFLVAINQAMA